MQMKDEQIPSPEQRISNVEVIVAANPEVAGLQAYEYFRSNAGEQKEAYLGGELPALDLAYPELEAGRIGELDQAMKSALVTLMPGERTPKSEALYRAVEYRYSELAMMDMARVMMSEDATEAERTEAEECFKRANEGLYGVPERRVFSALAQEVADRCVPQEGDDADVARTRQELADLLGPIGETDFEPLKPDDETVQRISALAHERFDSVVEHIDPEQTYDVPGMAQAMQTVTDKLGASELGWEVVTVPNSNALAVSAHKKRVEVGENHLPITGRKLRGKALHEGIHMERSMRALLGGWLSAAYGQDGYLEFEEALAAAIEDAYDGKFTSHGDDKYLAAGLAYGLDNHEPRDFNEIFEIKWRNNVLKRVANGKEFADVVEETRSKTFNACLRIFRGTTTQKPGVVYLKDLAYFKGQERVWNFLKGVHTQEDLEIAFAGKVDLSRPDHLAIAEDIMANS